MATIPKKLKEELLADPYYKFCSLFGHHNHICGGRITFEHTLIFAGKQVQAKFAIIPLCARGHEVYEYQDAHTMNKEQNKWVALNRATDDELRSISKVINYIRERERLNNIFGGPYVTKIIFKPTPEKSPC